MHSKLIFGHSMFLFFSFATPSNPDPFIWMHIVLMQRTTKFSLSLFLLSKRNLVDWIMEEELIKFELKFSSLELAPKKGVLYKVFFIGLIFFLYNIYISMIPDEHSRIVVSICWIQERTTLIRLYYLSHIMISTKSDIGKL